MKALWQYLHNRRGFFSSTSIKASIQARTVDGMLFDTRDEAALNAKEFADFSYKLAAIQRTDIEALKELYGVLQQYTGKVAAKYSQVVSEKIEKLDLSRRTVKISIGSGKTVVFDTEM